MIVNSLITQLATFGLSLVIVFTFIMPTLEQIQAHQVELDKLQTEAKNVDSVKVLLDQLVQKRNSVSDNDRRRLNTYLPTTIDEVKVLRDLEYLASTQGQNFRLTSIQASQGSNANRSDSGQANSTESDRRAHGFSLGFITTFEQLRSFLSVIERNNYPLDIQDIKVSTTEGGFLNVDLSLVTYSLE